MAKICLQCLKVPAKGKGCYCVACLKIIKNPGAMLPSSRDIYFHTHVGQTRS